MKPEDVLVCKSLVEFRDLEALSFPTPWSARAFGLVLAAAERKVFSLTDFQQKLIEEIAAFERQVGPIDSDEVYYSRWVAALSGLLELKGVFGDHSLMAAEEAVRAALAANAHDHDHEHGIDHADMKLSPSPINRECGQ
ncbi:nitrile hydratase accessory protein [Paraburkholderia fynbosensis]|uniref:Nitrile hydratase beta subunit-like N-terminal domain-containing protein n=1 Tax=Paraburkholderia fynbosensis TaxID=1200993 RepID=A0A6J5GXZ6_9BURK|nr:nitrile hydratase accessory protein [Paraburkholderia fynbosensis]CAB3807337.1 hypothetical protein LMG27177_06313 [Paraburkholderia fynbosensis]